MIRLRDLARAAKGSSKTAREADRIKALQEAALKVRRAGTAVEHLIGQVDADELDALAFAGEILAAERAVLAALAIRCPEQVARTFDGGASFRRMLLRQSIASVKSESQAARAARSGQ